MYMYVCAKKLLSCKEVAKVLHSFISDEQIMPTPLTNLKSL